MQYHWIFRIPNGIIFTLLSICATAVFADVFDDYSSIQNVVLNGDPVVLSALDRHSLLDSLSQKSVRISA